MTKKEKWIDDFENFFWETGIYINRMRGIDPYKDFISNLLQETRKEVIDDLTRTMSKIYKLDKADMWLYDFVKKYKKEDYNNL